MVGLAALTVSLGVAAVVAVRNAREARRQERVATAQAELATSRQLAAQSIALAPSELDLSLLLALTAGEIVDTADTRGALLRALETNPKLVAYVRTSDGPASAIAASSDRMFAVGDSSGTVRVFDFEDLSLLATTRAASGDPVTSLAFSHNEDLLAVGTEAGEILLWSLTGAEQTERLSGVGPSAAVAFVVFDSASDQLAVTWSDVSHTGDPIANMLAVWDLSARQAGIRLGPVEAPIGTTTMGFPDSDNLMVFGFFEMHRFDVDSGTVVETWQLQTGGAHPGPSAHSSNGEVGAWSTLDRGDISIYHPGPTTVDTVADISIEGGALDGMKWDQTGSMLGVAKEGSISLWNADGQQLALMTGAESGIVDLAFAANSDRMASLGNGVVQVWDPGANSRLGIVPPISSVDVPNVVKRVVDVDWSAEGDLVTWVVDPGGLSRHEDVVVDPGNSVAVWNLDTNGVVTLDTTSTPCALGFVDDRIATAEADCQDEPALEVWNTAGGPVASSQIQCVPDGTGSWKSTPSLSPDPVRLASDREICDRGQLRRIDLADAFAATGVSPVSAIAAVSTDSSVAAVLDISATNLLIGRLDRGSHFEPTRRVGLTNPTGFAGPTTPYVSPDGSAVVVTYLQPDPTESTQGRLLGTVWDVETGSQVGTIGPAAVDDVAFSPGGEMLAVALGHGDIEIRDGDTMQLITVLPGDGDAPTHVLEFSPDGRKLAEATSGGGLVIWNLDIEAWTRRACGITGRTLTTEEIGFFLGDLEPSATACAGATATSAEVPPRPPALTTATSVVPATEASPGPGPTFDANTAPETTPVVTQPSLADRCIQNELNAASPEIRFQPGTSSKVVQGDIAPDGATQYRLAASETQVVHVSIDIPQLLCLQNAAGFLVSGIGQLIVQLPATDVYFLTVVALDQSGHFSMEVAIP